MSAPPAHAVDWRAAAAELLRALRGARSQVAFARRLGFRSNVPAAWEGGHRCPDAPTLLRVCAKIGVDAEAAFARFHPPAAAAISAEGLGPWLHALRGRTPVAELAARSGCSAPQLRRWLGGQAQPKVYQLLALVEALTGRAPDLVAELVDIEAVPTLAGRHAASRTQRRLAIERPWTAAVRVLVEASRPPTEGAAQALARALGQPLAPIEEALGLLRENNLVVDIDGRLVATGALTVDLRATPEDRRQLRAHWARAAADRVGAGAEDLFSFSLVALSRADLERVRELQRRTFRELRGIVSASQPVEVCALVIGQVAAFDLREAQPPASAEAAQQPAPARPDRR